MPLAFQSRDQERIRTQSRQRRLNLLISLNISIKMRGALLNHPRLH